MKRDEKENQFLSDDEDEDEDEDDDEDFVATGKRKYDIVTTKREKRNKHNCSERKRRFVIRDAFVVLGERIPSVRQGGQQGRAKASRAQILKKASEYMVSLKAAQEKYQKSMEDLRERNANIEREIQEMENANTVNNIDNSSSNQYQLTEGQFVISPHGIGTFPPNLTPKVIASAMPQSFINFENHFEVSKFIKSEEPHSVPSCSSVTKSLPSPSPSSFLQSEIPVSFSAASSSHSFIKSEYDDIKIESLDESSYESSSDDDSDCDYFSGPKRFKIN